jgi:hypothetical protein
MSKVIETILHKEIFCPRYALVYRMIWAGICGGIIGFMLGAYVMSQTVATLSQYIIR